MTEIAREAAEIRRLVPKLINAVSVTEKDMGWAGYYLTELSHALDAARRRAELAEAERDRLRALIADIEDCPRTRGTTFRADGKKSKHDTCSHGVVMYEDCFGCVHEHLLAALSESAEAKED